MRNIELKARLAALEAARRTAERLCGEGPAALLGQTDTYFQVDRGRLKLREIEPRGGSPTAELIFYLRADQKGPKRSEYEIAPCADPAALKRVLQAALGLRAVVTKERTLFLYRNVRIHLDRVDGLGPFLEFEAVMQDAAPDAEGEALLRTLGTTFGIRPEDRVQDSYVDLLERSALPGV